MRKFVRYVGVLVSAVLMLGAVVIAPAAGSTAAKAKGAKTTFVGKVDGTDAYIGIVIGKGTAVAYICDSAEVDEWVSGAASHGVVALQSLTNSTLVAIQEGKKVRGTVVLPDNRVLAFTAAKATGKAGVFKKSATFNGVTLTKAWVRLADGTTRGGGGLLERAQDFVQNVGDKIDAALQAGADAVANAQDAVHEVIDQIGDRLGIGPDVVVTAPVGSGVPSCPPFHIPLPSGACVRIPPVAVPAKPSADATPPDLPPLAQTIAGARAAKGTGADAGFAPPAGDAFDAAACARIDRALALISDELGSVKAGSDTETVFTGVFTSLRDRGTAGGCADLPAAP